MNDKCSSLKLSKQPCQRRTSGPMWTTAAKSELKVGRTVGLWVVCAEVINLKLWFAKTSATKALEIRNFVVTWDLFF